ncbi:MAG: phosphoglucosamine mutase [Alphaproteobacteria bacterium]|nr:phosphoglucosamine mutase [Alphaproteobacteria bacterium]
MSKKSFFGTDGIRGIANEGNITADIAMKLGAAAGTIFKNGTHRHLVVIGKDTRLSGYLLEPALTSGFIAMGMDVLLVGPMPTPAISMLVKSLRADLGIVISASHNPYQYNGIKIFGRTGSKLDKDTENKIEDLITNYPKNIKFAPPENLGKAERLDDAPGRYIEFAKHTFPEGKTLHGLKIVVDSANGASYHVARKIFWELGADVIHIGNKPDGFNINQDCGSMHCDYAREAVLFNKANLGIVLDGDADRVIIIDEKGNIIDGDKILATIALYMKSQGTLAKNTVVATHMSNIGLEKFLNQNDIQLLRTDVGDKHVSRLLEKEGYTLGGEQSGHIIIPQFSSTGDGIVAALKVLSSFVESNIKTISQLCNTYNSVPQILHNIKYCNSKPSPETLESVSRKLSKASDSLKDNGRILLRRSGTEPLVRIMIESSNTNLVQDIIKDLSSEIEKV